MTQKLITIVSPCYNEELNVREMHRRLRAMAAELPSTALHSVIDNASGDNTVGVLRELAAEDPAVRVIVNARNFGHALSHARTPAGGRRCGGAGGFRSAGKRWAVCADGTGVGKRVAHCGCSEEFERRERPMYGIRTGYYRLVARLTNVRSSSITQASGSTTGRWRRRCAPDR